VWKYSKFNTAEGDCATFLQLAQLITFLKKLNQAETNASIVCSIHNRPPGQEGDNQPLFDQPQLSALLERKD